VKTQGGIWYSTINGSLSPDRHGVLRIGFFLLLALVALNAYAPASPDLGERFLASLIILEASIPSLLWMSGVDQAPPILPLACFLYAVYCSGPIFLLDKYAQAYFSYDIIPDRYLKAALIECLIGIAALILGFYGPQHLILSEFLPKLSFRWESRTALFRSGLFLAVLGIASMVIGFRYLEYTNESVKVGPFQQMFHLLTECGYLGLTILFFLYQTHGLNGLERAISYLIFFLLTALGLASGTITRVLRLALPPLFIHGLIKHRLPWKLIFIGIGMVAILQPAKTLFRVEQNLSGTRSVLGRVSDFAYISMSA
jgi:hypothetical protein